MTREELIAKSNLERQGYKVLTSGWPDLLAIKTDPDGSIHTVAWEIKSAQDPVRPHQKEMHDALRDAGLTVSVLRLGPGKKLKPKSEGVY